MSPTGFKLLRLYLAHPGEVLSRDAFVQEVWMAQPHASERTVDVHIKFLRDAFRPLDTMIETVRSRRYRLSSSPSH
ncbi:MULTISPECIES: winged helix-turn-helix domain-containing protein [unclassified Paraburkholderia]|uniref:winged helix-turn-helix domain-containing protein n=1 Tax=unclassified Paraburkholderia TaxID=2615204 RepID=UPI0038B913F2